MGKDSKNQKKRLIAKFIEKLYKIVQVKIKRTKKTKK